MEWMSFDWLGPLLAIIFIDLVLAGDNAIVIGLAARHLPADEQKKAIFWGTAGAIGVRLLASFVVVWLLKIPALMAVGGLLLLNIAYKLLTEENSHHTVDAKTGLGAAIRTIIIADGVMGIDNVLGIAGVAEGNLVLIAIGLLVTVPLVIWGSTAFIHLVEKYPAILYLGAMVLAWTAGQMITGDALIKPLLQHHLAYKLPLELAIVSLTLFFCWRKRQTLE